MTLLLYPLVSRPCGLVQGKSLVFLTLQDFQLAALDQNTPPWSLWKRQYILLLHLLGSPFIFSGHFKDGSSLICIRTYSSGTFNGVYCWFRAEGPDFLLSRSFLSSVRPLFGQGPCSDCRLGFPSILSDLFLFLAIMASFAFMKFWAKWTAQPWTEALFHGVCE